MFCKIVFFLLITCNSSLCKNKTKVYYCVVDAGSPGIVITDSEGKDGNYLFKKSTYLYETTTFNFTNDSDWTLTNSINTTDLNNEPVLDERWENFPDNCNDGTLQLLPKMGSVRLSVKIYNTFFNLSTGEWHNNLTSNGSGLYSDNGNHEETAHRITKYPKNIWKLHEYNFLYRTTPRPLVDSLIYVSTEVCNSSRVEKSCISFYLAMCANCTIHLQINDTNSQIRNKNFTAERNRHWKKEKICLENFGGCFNISVATNKTDDGFWAISDVGYYTKYPSKTCKDDKRYIEVKGHKTEIQCETSDNTKISLNTTRPEMNCPTNHSTEMTQKEEGGEASLDPILYLAIILPSCLVIGTILVGVYFYRKKPETKTPSKSEDYSSLLTKESTVELKAFTNTPKWPGVFRKDFANYVQKCFDPESDSKKLLRNQFNDLPDGFLKEAHEGLRPDNLKKNRYPHIIPYDENRVLLKRNLDEAYQLSDYINASYIKGFNGDKEYIITQNPVDGSTNNYLDHTITDFWRMIWQEEVDHIVMINSVHEEYVRYWPEADKRVEYGGIEIRLLQNQKYKFYVHRTLQIRRYGNVREVNQLHFHFWPDDKKIASLHTFVEFINHMLTIPHRSSPVVLHCLAGTSRSGTIALCDIALRTQAVTGTINMFEIAQQLRFCRVNMVQNVKQYQLAHLIVMEVLHGSAP